MRTGPRSTRTTTRSACPRTGSTTGARRRPSCRRSWTRFGRRIPSGRRRKEGALSMPYTADRSAIKADLIAEVARSATTFWELELTSGLDAGDTSLRDPDTGHVYILPRPNPEQPFANWSEIGGDDVVVVDRGGTVVHTNGLQPTV